MSKMKKKRQCLVCGYESSVLIDPNGICSLCNSVFTDWRLKKNWSKKKPLFKMVWHQEGENRAEGVYKWEKI